MRLAAVILALAALRTAISVRADEECSWLNESTECAAFWSGGAPPVLLIALGGFRPEYLNRVELSRWKSKASPAAAALKCLAQSGVSAPFMMPVYPTLTQPNLYSIVTGLYPESHGIVADEFYDARINATFNPFAANFNDPRWWKGGEPIWATIAKQGKLSAVDSWPGSSLLNDTMAPNYRSQTRANRSLKERMDQIVKWLLMTPEQRPVLIASYWEEADWTGRVNGPGSQRVTNKIRAVDEQIGRLMDELSERNVTNCVNIIIVSDHGLAESPRNKSVDLNRVMKDVPDGAAVRSGAPVNVESKRIIDVDSLKKSLECRDPHVKVWTKWELPYRMHSARSHRIADVVLDMDLGWKGSFHQSETTKGGSGWDNLHDDMHAIFLAYGPSFRKQFKVTAFENVHLYNLMCTLVGVTPAVNDGVPGVLHHLLADPPKPVNKSGSKASVLRLPRREEVYRQKMVSFDCRLANKTVKNSWQQDLSLNISGPTEAQLLRLHAPFGVPLTSESSVNRTAVLVNHDYVTGFDFRLGMPRWVQYRIRGINEHDGDYSMRLDPRLPVGSQGTCNRLQLQRYHQQRPLVHFFPPAFGKHVDEAWLETNMMEVPPRVDNLMASINKLLAEAWIEQGAINVISGPTQGSYDAIFYVVSRCTGEHDNFVDCPVQHQDVQAFLVPRNLRSTANCPADQLDFLRYHVATLNDVERVTGLTFFPELPVADKLKLLARTTLESRLLVKATPG